MNYYRRSDDIVGYQYNASIYCSTCITNQLPTGKGERFDGWQLHPSINMPVEDDLDEIALAFGINRLDETSYDSSEFPKVVFRDAVDDDVTCDACFNEIS